ncbi:MAG: NADP-dependent malic enzyme, partial [Acidobacteria bacterium]|nr:NADP-dependent malic enzyme [Acidobacteriota bacterium]
MSIRKEDALRYHEFPTPGKLSITPTKPCRTQLDLSLAYTPGVAEPCLEIARNPQLGWKYTSRSNLVAVVTNGTAVLGLGNIGPLAGKPVMEGKAVLFKRFADIDVFDLEVNSSNPDEVIRVVQLLELTFGGINLEDIKAPECFYIEETLRKTVRIPVFHDDQHGTAIISGAALINAVQVAGKRLDQVKVVFNGAGAAGISCADLYVRLGVKPQNIVMCDSVGVIYKGRQKGMNPYKERFAADTERRTLAEAMQGADVFVGVSVANCVTPEMLRSMAERPIVFAMANPDPEIRYEEAMAARSDVIMATGRSDYPNQVNNVLGFPFIFRGALDSQATSINDEMKLAAAHALAELARQDVPDAVRHIYPSEKLDFGPGYIIPKPFDPRVLETVPVAVARAAMESGVAQKQLDLEEYRESLARRLGMAQEVFRVMSHKAQQAPKRIVFPEGEEEKILRAAQILCDEKIAHPILLGDAERIQARARELGVHNSGWETLDPARSGQVESYAQELYEARHRKGVTRDEAREMLRNPMAFSAMMVRRGDADGMVAGITKHYPETIRPALQIVSLRPGVNKVSGLYVLMINRKLYFLADATVNIEPTAEDLAEIAILAAERARRFDVEPRVAMLSFSNFGSARHALSDKVRRAVEIVHRREPELLVDGEMQADTALNPELIERFFPFSRLKSEANILVFPNLEAANITYKLLIRLAGAEAIGPILMGMGRPVAVLQKGFDVQDVVTMATIAVLDAQETRQREQARLAAERARRFDVEPRVAMLS